MEIILDETKPEYYLRSYKDNETFTSITHETYKESKYTGAEYRNLFMLWYNKIKPFLDENNKHGVIIILMDWNEETLAKFDLYTLVMNHFENLKVIK